MLKQRNSKFNNRVFIVSYADMAALGAVLTGNVNLPLILPAGAVVKRVLAKQTVQFAAPSLGSLTLAVGSATGTYLAAGNIFAAPAAETYIHTETPFREKIGSTAQVFITPTATVANLNALTAGEVQVIISYEAENFVTAGGIFL